MKQERKDQPNIKGLEGVSSGNPKFKEGEMQNAYDKANATEEGKKTLPTVPQ